MKHLLCSMLVLAGCSFLPAQSEGYWKFSAKKQWPYSVQPGRTDAKWAQNFTEHAIQFTYQYFDQNGTGKWLTDTESFDWDMLDPAHLNQSILPKNGNETLIPNQKVRMTATVNFIGQYYSSASAKVNVGEPPLQTPNGWKSSTDLYPMWGYYTDPVLYITAGNNSTKSDFADFTVPKGPFSGNMPLTIRCTTGLQGSAAIEYLYDWVPPPVPVITGVVQNTTGLRSITPGAWMTVYGTSLAPKTREWTTADFNGKQLPTSLDSVQVLVHGKPALVSFISPGQINALAPTDTFTGDADVQVITPNGKSTPYTVTLARLAPGFFLYQVAGAKYVISHAGSEFIGKPGLVSGLVTRPVKPGEIITLYGTGFGPATQQFAPETTVSGSSPLASAVNVKIGGAAATVYYAGQIGSGLYQFNVAVPDVANGDQEILADIGGVTTPPGTLISVQR